MKKFVAYSAIATWNILVAHAPFYPLRHAYLRLFLRMRLSRGANIHRGVMMFNPWGVSVGAGSNIQMGSFLDGRGGLHIGSNVDITLGVRILTEDHDVQDPSYRARTRTVRIGDNVVIGSYSLILPGVQIGEGAVVGAGSVVTKNVDAFTIVGGNPAAPLRDRSREIRYRCLYRRPWH